MKRIILTATFITGLLNSYPAAANTDFFEIRDALSAYKAEKKGKTTAQKAEIDARKKDYIKSLTGETVEWHGWVDDVKSYDHWVGEGIDYKIQIDMEPPSKFFSTWDVSFRTENNAASKLTVDLPIIINGTIKKIDSSGHIDLEHNYLKVGHDKPITEEELHIAVEKKEAIKQKQKADRAALKEKSNQIEEQGAEAYIACKTSVKNRLTSPRTAKFPWLGGWDYRVLPDNKTATVRSYVDSQNQFGAEIRTNFECRMRYLGEGKWLVEAIE